MTIVTYEVTPDYRYFYRRTKRDIIDKIEQMVGVQYTFNEREAMMSLSKAELASIAFKICRSLPDNNKEPLK